MALPRFRLHIEDWPDMDRDAWQAACRTGDPLDDPGAASHWTTKTSDTVSRHYGIWLAFLQEQAWLDANTQPHDRVTREALVAYIDWMKSRNLSPVTIAGRITNLREAIRVMFPQADLAQLDHVLIRVNASAHPTRKKDVRVISPAVIWQAAIARMTRYSPPADGSLSRREAGRYRDGLMTAILASVPLRLANLAGMEMDRHLHKRGEIYWCRFLERETKDKRPMEFPLRAALTPWIDVYLAVYRPALLRDASSRRVWISLRGTPMPDNTIYCAICQVTEEEMGQPVNPHLFRDCVATFVAEEAPEQIQIVARLLGHASLRSSEKHYNQAGMLSAQGRYLSALASMREEGPPPSKNRRQSERQSTVKVGEAP